MHDLVIRGGTIATAVDTVKCDVGVSGGVITALGRDLPKGAREIDASGKLVLPGGVDSHCHIEQLGSSGGYNADTWTSGTTSAACGGTTTVICFSPTKKGATVKAEAESYHALAKKAVIDYSFHIIVNDANERVLAELPELIETGHRSIKMFMTYDNNYVDDATILKVFAVAREHAAFVTIHAENHEAITWMTKRLVESGHTAMKYHSWSKPPVVEREATHRVIALAEMMDQPIQIFHVTCAEAAEEIHRAQQRGLKIFAETCIQYLILTDQDMDRPGFEGAKFICSPSPRTPADQEALWNYLRTGVLGVVSSDHAPYRYNDPKGKQQHGTDAPFSKVPNGLPGIETRMPLLFSEGVMKGRIDLNTFVALTATNPAKLFGIHPQKGTIAVGADADIGIWDPHRKVTIRNEILHHLVDYTPYEGMEVTGWPVTTLSRGSVVWEDGKVLAEPGRGKFLARKPYDYIRPRGRFTTAFNPITGEIE